MRVDARELRRLGLSGARLDRIQHVAEPEFQRPIARGGTIVARERAISCPLAVIA
jgi:hypothetical protein